MRRTQIYIEEDLDDELRQVAAAEGRSAAAVIREALRAYLSSRSQHDGADDPILAMAGTLEGLAADAALEHDRDLYGGRSRTTRQPRSSRRR